MFDSWSADNASDFEAKELFDDKMRQEGEIVEAEAKAEKELSDE